MDRNESGEWAKVIGMDVQTASPKLLKVALAAANAIGESLYGIDLKEIDGEFYVIEVNDNPTIAAGEEDQGNPGIYAAVIRHLAGDG
jgi:glutathione synthase/RimK-type ligase-like ATP-grasp enzyme